PVTIAPAASSNGAGPEHWVDALKRRQDRLDERGSFRELRLALAWLEREDERRFRVLWRLVVCEPWIERTGATQRLLDRIVDTLALLIPGDIRVPAEQRRVTPKGGTGRWANGSAQTNRDAEMRRLRDQGVSGKEIARQFGVSPATVTR